MNPEYSSFVLFASLQLNKEDAEAVCAGRRCGLPACLLCPGKEGSYLSILNTIIIPYLPNRKGGYRVFRFHRGKSYLRRESLLLLLGVAKQAQDRSRRIVATRRTRLFFAVRSNRPFRLSLH